MLTFYCFVRLIGSNDARWWLAIGGSIGLGMLTKYSMLFCVAGVVAAFVFARRWRDLHLPWLWLGAVISLLVFLPNLALADLEPLRFARVSPTHSCA